MPNPNSPVSKDVPDFPLPAQERRDVTDYHEVINCTPKSSTSSSFVSSSSLLCSLFLYPIFLIVITIVLPLNVGVYSWLVIAASLAPPTLLLYYALKKRIENYFAMLLKGQAGNWDVDKLFEEYMRLLEKKDKDKS